MQHVDGAVALQTVRSDGNGVEMVLRWWTAHHPCAASSYQPPFQHRGEFSTAADYLHKAVQRLTTRNPNPYDGEALYSLGITLRALGRDDEAYGMLYKATWNYAWQAAAFLQLAQIDCQRGVCGCVGV